MTTSLTRRALIYGTGATAIVGGASLFHQSRLSEAHRKKLSTQFFAANNQLPKIGLFDARANGLPALLKSRLPIVHELLDAALGPLTPLASAATHAGERLARGWFAKNASPYYAELEAIAGHVQRPGVFLLNSSYEWGCTALATPSATGDSAQLLRTLDWPLAGLGRFVDVVWQRGPAGDFLNVTWPGSVAVLTAMAPGRFAASINQAPTRRRWSAEWLLSADAALNTLESYMNVTDTPSLHVLRHVFETARDFAQARKMLETTPVASPVIFTLVGLTADETCVIERTTHDFATHTGISSAANAWRYGKFAGDWHPMGADANNPRGDNDERSAFIESYAAKERAPFDWVKAPVLNDQTRLAVEADPKHGILRVRGFEEVEASDVAAPATEIFEMVTPA